MPKVSVIIPVYNVEKYLRECLDSLINQTLKDIEIICINDGSTDSSLEILKEYAQNDKRIKIIDKQNTGYGASMNIGLDNAQGEYIGIVEPDDYIELYMYEELYNIISQHDADFVKADIYKFGEKSQQCYVKIDCTDHYYDKITAPKRDKGIFDVKMYTWSGIYKTNFIKTNNIRYNETPGARYQDQGFYFQTMIYAKAVYITNMAFYHYRFLNTNSTNNPNGFFWIKTEYEYILNILNNQPELKSEFINLYQYHKFRHYLFKYMKLNKKQKRKVLRLFRKEFQIALKNNEFDKTLLTPYETELFDLLTENPNRFYRIITNSRSMPEKIFSVKNTRSGNKIYKVLCICGIKLKFRNKLKELKIMEEETGNAAKKMQNQIYCHDNDTALSIWEIHGAEPISLAHFDFTSLSRLAWQRYPKQYWLIYLSCLIEVGETKKAEQILNKYLLYYNNNLEGIERFLLVSKFVGSCGITNEKISIAAKIYDTFEENRKNEVFKQILSGKTIAIVGNAPSEVGKNKGAEIDSHDLVIRFNNFKIKGFEKDYGCKTDIWSRGSGASDVIDRTEKFKLVTWEADYNHYRVMFNHLDILYRQIKQNQLIYNFDYENHITLRRASGTDFPTTGLVLIWEIYQKFGNFNNVNFYGFNFLQDIPDNYATHYFIDRTEEEAKKRSAPHFIDRETEFLTKLVLANKK